MSKIPLTEKDHYPKKFEALKEKLKSQLSLKVSPKAKGEIPIPETSPKGVKPKGELALSTGKVKKVNKLKVKKTSTSIGTPEMDSFDHSMVLTSKIEIEDNSLPSEEDIKKDQILIKTHKRVIFGLKQKKPGSTLEDITSCVFLLFGLGMASKRNPNSTFVAITNVETNIRTKLTKGEYLSEFKLMFNNKKVRLIAKLLRTTISEFLEKHSKSGDLTISMTIYLSNRKDESNLTNKEAAWCSSFNQNNPRLLEKDLIRVNDFLMFDLKERKRLNEKNNKKLAELRLTNQMNKLDSSIN